jgi:hypothetical protein
MPEDRRAYDPFAPAPASPTSAEQQRLASGASATASASDGLEDMSRADLIELAEQRGVAAWGSKTMIAARIREAQGNG